jgi:predicted benzoate:H+ symporter BenE
MRRLWLAAALAAAIIVTAEVAPASKIGLAVAVAIVLSIVSEITWFLSPKFWREVATVRFWIVLVGLVLVGIAAATLRV